MRSSLLKSQIDLYGANKKLDVALLHAPFCWAGHCTPAQESYSWMAAWRNLESLHADQLVSAIGVSNFHPDQLRDLLQFANTRVSVVQNWMDPFHQDAEVRAICREYNIAYMAYSSLGGQWEYISGVNRNPVFTDPTLLHVAEKHNCSVSTVVLSWALQEGVVVIPRSTKPQKIHENAGLLTYNRIYLDDVDLRIIRLLDGTLGEP